MTDINDILRTFDSDMRSARTDNYGEHIINAKETAEKGAKAALNAYYLKEFLKCVGEDEVDPVLDDVPGWVIEDRNELRAEIRAKLKENKNAKTNND